MRLQVAVLLIAAFFSLSLQSAERELRMLSTMDVVEEISSVEAREQVVNFIKNEKVQKELGKLGVDQEEALARVASLSNTEVKKLSTQINKAQAGGDFGVGGIIGAMVFIFIILLITDILGFTKVFPFTRSIR
jgi:Skp family chaperone for outer membrane proteins